AGHQMVELRLGAKEYLHALSGHLMAGFSDQLSHTAWERDRRTALSVAHRAVDSQPPGLVRPIVSLYRELPKSVREDPSLHHQDSEFVVIVPESVDLDEFADRLIAPAIYGPPVPWAELPDTLTLLWRAAALAGGRAGERTMI